MSSPERRFREALDSKWLLGAPGIIAATLGIVVLAGWHIHSVALVQLRSALPPMCYNSALCLVLAGGSLLALGFARPRISALLAGLVALIAILTLDEDFFSVDLRIDQLLFKSYLETPAGYPGRMSFVTALCFLQVGLALLALRARAKVRWATLAAGSLGAALFTTSTLSLLGYMLALPGAYTWGQLARIAPFSAVGIAFLGAGIFIGAWKASRGTLRMAPYWLPISVGLSALTATVVIWQALETNQRDQGAQSVRIGAESVRDQLGIRMEARLRFFERMAKHWQTSGQPAEAVWRADADALLEDSTDIEALEWVDAAHLVQWIAPKKGNEDQVQRNITSDEAERTAAQMAETQRQTVVTRTVKLPSGEAGFFVYTPIYVGTNFQGFIVAALKAKALFDRYLPPAVAVGDAISITESGRAIYERNFSTPPAGKGWTASARIDLHGATWNIRVWPTPESRAQLDSPLPELELGVGLIGSLLLGLSTHLAQAASGRAREAHDANRELQAALAEVKTLSGLLPICTCCKRVRDDTGYWNQIESYLARHSDASFSHSYCPECKVKMLEEAGLTVPPAIRAAHAEKKFE